MHGKEFKCGTDSLSSSGWDVVVLVSEMVHCWYYVKPYNSVISPYTPFLWEFMYNDIACWWQKWSFWKLNITHSWLYADIFGFIW